jgi:hypothetical protein
LEVAGTASPQLFERNEPYGAQILQVDTVDNSPD